MKFRNFPFVVASILPLAPAAGADIDSVANGAYTAGTTWSGGLAPSAGNNYTIKNTVTVTTASGVTNTTLAGDAVTVASAGVLEWKINTQSPLRNLYVNNLTLDGGKLLFDSSNQYSRTHNLGNLLTVSSASTFQIGSGNQVYDTAAILGGGIAGPGNLNVIGNVADAAYGAKLQMTVPNSAYTGNWSVASGGTGYVNLSAEAAKSLGTGTVTLGVRSTLTVAAANGIDSTSGVKLTDATSSLVLTNAWTNTSASLEVQVGTVKVGNATSSIGNLSGIGGAIQGTGATSALTVNQTVDATYSGALEQTAGNSLAFTKTGSSTLTLGGTSTYTGATTVSAGTLLVTGALGATAVTVADAASIGGSGSIGGTLDLGGGSLLDIYDIGDALAVTGGSTFGTGFGLDNLTGWDYTSAANGTYTVLAGTIDPANLDNLGLANAVPLGGGRSVYFEVGSGSTNLNVVVIPESTSALLGGIGLIALLGRRRRRA